MAFLKWLLFSVIFALSPLIFSAFRHWSHSANKQPGSNAEITLPDLIKEVLGEGELLLISTAIAGEAIGDLLAGNSRHRKLKLTSGAGCLLVIVSSVSWYGDIKSPGGTFVDPEKIVSGSAVLFFLTLITAASCKLVSKD